MEEQLGIVRDIHIGVRDTNHPCCYFNIELLDGVSLQILSMEQCVNLIEQTHCYKLEDLNNKPCIVQIEINLVKFLKMK